MSNEEKKYYHRRENMSLDDLIAYRDDLLEEAQATHHEIFSRLREAGGWDKVKPNK